MIYSNPEFFALLAFALLAYSQSKTPRSRFIVLLLASTAYYAWAGWRDLIIFELVMLVCWLTVFFASAFPRRRKQFTAIGVTVILVHLLIWKYLSWVLAQIPGGPRLQLAVPLGISFYTLQKIAYLIDVYRGSAEPVRLREYLLLNGFFPQLIAGPIARASALMPQLRNLQRIRASKLWSGMGLFMLGFFKKVALADSLGTFVDQMFSRPYAFRRGELLLGVAAFATQLWADFSGYTDMGRGAARMFGVELPENFRSPFLARGPGEFWRRWHITLSEWFRDYLFLPLWLKHQSKLGGGLVLILTMLLAGLWHGANWTFVLYGFYWGALLLLEHLWRRTTLYRTGYRQLPGLVQWAVSLPMMLVLMAISRVIFRASDLREVANYFDALLFHPGSYTVDRLGVVGSFILVSFAIQIVTYQRLEEGAQPLWKKILEPWRKRLPPEHEWSPGIVGLAGVAFGVTLVLAFIGSISLSLPSSTRDFIYW